MDNVTIGIIGQGSFGKFLYEKLVGAGVEVAVCSNSKDAPSMRKVSSCDYLVLAVPLEAYEEVLGDYKNLGVTGTVLIDVCSVKTTAIDKIHQLLPNRPMVATHPLFGPESAAESMKGHTLVMCPESSDPFHYQKISMFMQLLGLRVIRMSAENHDKEMAVIQGLTFYVARAVRKFGVKRSLFSTPSYSKLLALADLDEHHSDALFETIQNGNKYTKEVRNKLRDVFEELDDQLMNEDEKDNAN